MTASQVRVRQPGVQQAAGRRASRWGWRSASIVVIAVAVGAVTNLATSAFDLGRWRWWLTGALVILGVVWAVLDGFGGPSTQDVLPTEIVTVTQYESAAGVARPWTVGRLERHLVERPDLARSVMDLLLQEYPSTVGLTTALHGAGGFGKTTLAMQVCMDARLVEKFPGGLVWVTVGEHRRATDVAASINDLCEQLTGRRPSFVDPEQAGHRLGHLLDSRPPTLLVIDDVWTSDQLRPFLLGGRTATRLVTTRVPGLLPADAVAVRVDEMEIAESRRLLISGLPPMPGTVAADLIRLTGRWPLLLSLANGALRRAVRHGATAERAAVDLARRLAADGPMTLDLTVERLRNQAVGAAIRASLNLLSDAQRDRYRLLAIFAEGQEIPLSALHLLWRSAGSVLAEVDVLCGELSELSLVAVYDSGRRTVRLHGVLRSYLRHTWSENSIVAANDLLLDRLRATLVTPPGQGTPWWLMDADAPYLWANLCYHLTEAGHKDELASLVCDLRWAERRIVLTGVEGLESDLRRCASPLARTLQKALAKSAHLFGPLQPTGALADVLVSRLADHDELRPVVELFTATLPSSTGRLTNGWPLPDHNRSLRRVLVGHEGPLTECAISSDGDVVITASMDGTVRHWAASSGQQLSTLTAHPSGVTGFVTAADSRWIATSGYDGSATIYDDNGEVRAKLTGHSGIDAFAAAPDNTWVMTTGRDRTVRLWDVATGQQKADLGGSRLSDHLDRMIGCAIAPDGTWFVTGGIDGTLRIWNMSSGLASAVLLGHTGGVNGCRISPDGTWIVSIGEDSTVRTWDAVTGAPRLQLTGHRGPVTGCAIAGDGRWLVTVGGDGTARTWNAATGELRDVLTGHADKLSGCAIAPDGSWLVTSSWDNTARIWEASSDPRWHRSNGHTDRVTGCAVSSDGSWLVTASWDSLVCVRDRLTGQVRRTLAGHTERLSACGIAPSDRWLVTASWDGTARIWDVESGQQIRVLAAHRDRINDCAIAPDGAWLATVGEDAIACIWEAATGKLRHKWAAHNDRIAACAIGGNGDLLATAADDGTVRLWSTSSYDYLGQLATGDHRVTGCTFSSDEATLITVGWDRTIRLWDSRRLTETTVFRGHSAVVTSCAVSPDGSWLASTGEDGCLRIWAMTTGDQVAAMRVDGGLAKACWTPDGSQVLAVGASGQYLFSVTGSSSHPARSSA